MSERQITRLRDLLNAALHILLPNLSPGQPIELPNEHLHLIHDLFSKAASTSEIKAYIELEMARWANDETQKRFLDKLLRVIDRD